MSNNLKDLEWSGMIDCVVRQGSHTLVVTYFFVQIIRTVIIVVSLQVFLVQCYFSNASCLSIANV